MALVVRVFEEPVRLDGVSYFAQVCGRANRHLWEGWLEFAATDGSAIRRTERETTQPDCDALVYWSEGLSGTYLQGALARALTRPRTGPPATHFWRAVLDPFSVGAKGEQLLRQKLSALRGWHLRNILRRYQLVHPCADLESMTERQLVDLIVAGVRPALTTRNECPGVTQLPARRRFSTSPPSPW
jgi:hypothetical protein